MEFRRLPSFLVYFYVTRKKLSEDLPVASLKHFDVRNLDFRMYSVEEIE